MPPNPVLLIHGIGDTAAVFRRMQRYLEEHGLRVHSFDLVPNDGSSSLTLLAGQLDAYVRSTFADGETIDLVGFSMGGLISRWYLQRLGGMERVRRFVSIATPHQGTWMAYLRRNPGAREMRPGSAFLADLNRDIDSLGGASFTSIWTPLDLMIVPATSSRAPNARSVITWVAAHPLMTRDARVLREVLRTLTGEDGPGKR